MNYKLKAAVFSDQGKVRTNNEDNFYFDGKSNCGARSSCHFSGKYHTKKHPVFAVFDGMGGESYGEVASEIAAKVLERYHKKIMLAKAEELPAIVDEFMLTVNQEIREMVDERHCGNSGTTMVMLCFREDMVLPFYIGDSRIYLYNGTDLYRLTSDHTLANHKLQSGVYTLEQATLSSDRNKLTQFLGVDKSRMGMSATAQPPLQLHSGYKFLLCSDGLTDMCDDLLIYQVLSENNPDAAKALLHFALESGGVDNTTLTLIEVLKR